MVVLWVLPGGLLFVGMGFYLLHNCVVGGVRVGRACFLSVSLVCFPRRVLSGSTLVPGLRVSGLFCRRLTKVYVGTRVCCGCCRGGCSDGQQWRQQHQQKQQQRPQQERELQ